MRIDQALEKGTPVLCVAELELELGKLGDGLDVCAESHRSRQWSVAMTGRSTRALLTFALLERFDTPLQQLASLLGATVRVVVLSKESPDLGALRELIDRLLEEFFFGLSSKGGQFPSTVAL